MTLALKKTKKTTKNKSQASWSWLMESLPLMDMDKTFGTVEWSDLCSPSDRWQGLWNGGPGPIHPTAPPLCLYTFLWRVFQSSEPQGSVTCENWLSPQHEMFEGRTREGYAPRGDDSATRRQQNGLKRPKKQGTRRLRSCLIILMFGGPIFQKKKKPCNTRQLFAMSQ